VPADGPVRPDHPPLGGAEPWWLRSRAALLLFKALGAAIKGGCGLSRQPHSFCSRLSSFKTAPPAGGSLTASIKAQRTALNQAAGGHRDQYGVFCGGAELNRRLSLALPNPAAKAASPRVASHATQAPADEDQQQAGHGSARGSSPVSGRGLALAVGQLQLNRFAGPRIEDGDFLAVHLDQAGPGRRFAEQAGDRDAGGADRFAD